MVTIREKLYLIIPGFRKTNNVYSGLKDAIWSIRSRCKEYEVVLLIEGNKGYSVLNYLLEHGIDKHRIKIYERDNNIAPSQALLDGFKHVDKGLILYLEPDIDLAEGQIESLLEQQQEADADVVIASKIHEASRVKYSAPRRLLSSIYSNLIKALFGFELEDSRPGLKLFKYSALKDIIQRMVTKEHGFDLELIVLSHKLGYKLKKAPVLIDFKANIRQLNPLAVYLTLVDTLAIFYRLRIMHYYERIQKKADKLLSVSIIIPVATNNKNLEENLQVLRDIDYPDYEVIVLPDDESLKSRDKKIKVIKTGKILPAEKRDKGIEASKGEIIAFLDDDAVPAAGWLKNAVRHFDDEDIAAVGGPAVTPDADSLMQKASGAVYASWLMAGKMSYRYIPYGPREVDDYPSCNLFIRKDILKQIGGLQTHYWPGEDTILCLKITKELGKKIIYDPDVLVYHHRRALFIPHLKQIARYALHRGYFVKKFPQTSFRLAYFLPSALLIWIIGGGVIALINSLFAYVYMVSICGYLGLVLLTALATTNPLLTLTVFFGIISSHITYGLFFLKGLLSNELEEDREQKLNEGSKEDNG